MKAPISNKQYHFLVSLPRTGNTLLASILNQNSEIAVTPNSITFELMKKIISLKDDSLFLNYPDHLSLDNVLNNLFNNYYAHWKQKYIIDRSLASLPGNRNFIKKYINQDVKYIVLVRDLLEVLSSFLKWAHDEPSSFLNKYSSIEEKLNFLMRKDGMIAMSLTAIQELYKHEKLENICMIKYHDLASNPEYQINKIYEFLNIKKFNHNFFDLNQFELNGIKYDDSVLGHNLHKIKENYTVDDNSFINLIPQSYKQKYEHIKF